MYWFVNEYLHYIISLVFNSYTVDMLKLKSHKMVIIMMLYDINFISSTSHLPKNYHVFLLF